jgi:hypothetical protein
MSQTTSRRRKVLAILAAGAVVGVGGAYTLAAWNDSGFMLAQFTSGSFNLEGSVDGSIYSEHDTAASAAEVFTLSTSNMVPDQVVYDSFFVRLDDATTVSGTLAVSKPATASGATDHYSYVVAALDSGASCDAAGIAGGTVIGQSTALDGPNAASASVPLTPGEDDNAGTPIELCIAVTASADLTAAAEATATWEFEATSDDAS